jgi:hypothetical protein
MNFLERVISGFKSSLAGLTGPLQNTAPAEENPVQKPQVSHENPVHKKVTILLAAPETSAALAPAATATLSPEQKAVNEILSPEQEAVNWIQSPEQEAVNRIQSPEQEVVNLIQKLLLNGKFNMKNFLKLLTTEFPEAVEGLFRLVLEPLLNSVPAASLTTPAQDLKAPTPTANTTLPILTA